MNIPKYKIGDIVLTRSHDEWVRDKPKFSNLYINLSHWEGISRLRQFVIEGCWWNQGEWHYSSGDNDMRFTEDEIVQKMD